MNIYTATTGFIFGTLISSIYPGVFKYIDILIYTSVFLLFLSKNKKILISLIFLSTFSLGITRFSWFSLSHDFHLPQFVLEKDVKIEGIVSSEPKEKENSKNFVLIAEKIEKVLINKTKILISTNRLSNIEYGDEISFTGKLKPPTIFETENGKEFDYVGYLGKDDIFYTSSFIQNTEVIDRNQASKFKHILFNIKRGFVEKIEEFVPEPHSSLLAGITVGVEESLGDELRKNLRAVGLIHIVVLSGYNITIIADIVYRLFNRFSRKLSFILSVTLIVLFTIMVGGTATIVRASIMSLIAISSRFFKREVDIKKVLFVVASLMIFFNPKILYFDPSFQLSFLATAGLIYLSPILESLMGKMNSLKIIVVSTLSTQIFVLPLFFFKIGEISLVSLIVNVLVLPTIPLGMLLGFLTSVTGFIYPPIAIFLGFVSYTITSYVFFVVEIFASLPFASIVF